MSRQFEDIGIKVAAVLIMLVIIFGSFGCQMAVRHHGITTCEDRGGTPVVHSLFSKDAWDVPCIEKTK